MRHIRTTVAGNSTGAKCSSHQTHQQRLAEITKIKSVPYLGDTCFPLVPWFLIRAKQEIFQLTVNQTIHKDVKVCVSDSKYILLTKVRNIGFRDSISDCTQNTLKGGLNLTFSKLVSNCSMFQYYNMKNIRKSLHTLEPWMHLTAKP